MDWKYDDIIHLPHHVSVRRSHIALHDRAAQFAPFAALNGHGAALHETARMTMEMIELSEDEKAVLDRKQYMLAQAVGERPQICVTCFMPDRAKQGGAYISISGVLKEADPIERVLIMENGERIPFDHVIDLDSRLFDGIF